MKKEIQLIRDEVAVLKKHCTKPKIEPSKLEKTNKRKNPFDKKKKWSKSSKNKKLIVDEEKKIDLPKDQVPKEAIFKGYKEFIVQDLIITKHTTRYLLAQWIKADRTYISAKLPKSKVVEGSHFGPGLHKYVLHQHYANRVPQNRIKSDLYDKNIEISAGQIDNLLKKNKDKFEQEKEDILQAGIQLKRIQTDDTAARHRGKNGFSTVVCNDFFTYFKSTDNKSRINFLEILCGKNIEYIITPETLNYINEYKESKATMKTMQQLLGSHFENHESWKIFLYKNLFGEKTKRILTEGALIGNLVSRKMITQDTILMSDGARQFELFKHILCWIHVERSIKRLIPRNEQDRKERDEVLKNFWDYYKELKNFKTITSEEQSLLKSTLNNRFDEIFSFNATEDQLAQALKKIRDNKSQLLLVLDCPDIPLHNNKSENDIREYVTKRKVSGGTRSKEGRDARDTFTSLYKTCKKLSISFWKYLDDRINDKGKILPLSRIIRQKINPSFPEGP